MCGRFALTVSDPEIIKKRFNLIKPPKPFEARYNIAPMQSVAVVRQTEENCRDIFPMRWGFTLEKKGTQPIINARIETLREKPTFRTLIASYRCLIIADAFYEWKREGKNARPFRITNKKDHLFAFAGLWREKLFADRHVAECVIVTAQANQYLRSIHPRMPVVLLPEEEKKWLADEYTDMFENKFLSRESIGLASCELSTAINWADSDSKKLIEPREKQSDLF